MSWTSWRRQWWGWWRINPLRRRWSDRRTPHSWWAPCIRLMSWSREKSRHVTQVKLCQSSMFEFLLTKLKNDWNKCCRWRGYWGRGSRICDWVLWDVRLWHGARSVDWNHRQKSICKCVGRHEHSHDDCGILCLSEAGEVLAGSKINRVGRTGVTVFGMEADCICDDYTRFNQYRAVAIVKC